MMRKKLETVQVVFSVCGSLFVFLGIVLLVPLVIALFDGEFHDGFTTLFAFLVPSAVAFVIGGLCRFLFPARAPSSVQAMLICSLAWLGFSAIGGLPFVMSIHANYIDGFFEAMSGFTTTGITMFTGLDYMPRSILFWRSLTQWIGGLGILTFFLFVTYRVAGGHRLFGAETHKIGMERPVPGMTHTLRILWSIYAGFTVLVFVGLWSGGMSVFDSVCHSFTALSTGGFSPHDASIGYYQMSGHPLAGWIEYVLIIGMIMGGTNFLIHYRVLNGRLRALFDNTEMRWWWSLILLLFLAIFLERMIKLGVLETLLVSNNFTWQQIEANIRTVLFQVVAIITTTGFSTQDIAGPFFGQVARQLFLIMMVIGGCVGSTGGGLKVLRVSILVSLIRRELFRIRAPSDSVSTVIIDGKPIDANEMYRVSGLFVAWVAFLVIGGIVTAFLSHFDAYQSFSGMFSALGNIGPCYIPTPAMGQLHPIVKIVYIIGMLAGRLEILPVLLLFSSRAWRS
jgi:trk system potassium uptake protein TrkH